jgi:hypothetical protein
MKVAVLGLGTRGDLYPLLGISRALVRRGHAVEVLEFDEYDRDVRDAGLTFVPVGTGSQCARVFENVPAGPATCHSEWVTDRLYCEASLDGARAFAAAVSHLDPRPDAILAPAHHVGATLGSDRLRVPLVSVFLGTSVLAAYDATSPTGLRSASDQRVVRLIDRFVLPRIAALRQELAIPGPPGETFARADRAGGLILTAAPLAGATGAMPPMFELAGYPDYYGPGDRGLPEQTRRFLTAGGPPVVVCSIGDGWARALPDQLQRLAERADQGRYRLLLIGGRIPGLSAGAFTRVESGVNLREVLRYADVSVNHGGMGTLVAALRGAVPCVMMSQWPDGRRNAAALAARGLGIDLGSAPGVDEVFQAVDAALADGALRARLREARAAMRGDRDPADALLDRLDREGVGNHVTSGTGGSGASG